MSNQNIQKGIEYMINNNLIDKCKEYKFSNEDISNARIVCIDDFYLLEDNENNDEINYNIKWDLTDISNSKTCYELAIYIYDLIKYIKET